MAARRAERGLRTSRGVGETRSGTHTWRTSSRVGELATNGGHIGVSAPNHLQPGAGGWIARYSGRWEPGVHGRGRADDPRHRRPADLAGDPGADAVLHAKDDRSSLWRQVATSHPPSRERVSSSCPVPNTSRCGRTPPVSWRRCGPSHDGHGRGDRIRQRARHGALHRHRGLHRTERGDGRSRLDGGARPARSDRARRSSPASGARDQDDGRRVPRDLRRSRTRGPLRRSDRVGP